MKYIIIDLEWNQSPLGKGTELKELPFEIIEIGAVKLNELGEVVDEFHEYIKPQVYEELHFKTQELLNIELEQLQSACEFTEVIKRFFEWCGENYFFCTWGAMDLTEIQRNLHYYELDQYIVGPIKYYDVQKLFSLQYEGKKTPHTLEYAVDFLGMDKQDSFHSAIHDARYTAKIFKLIENEIRKNYSIDCYRNPKSKKEEIYVVYDSYSKYISSEFTSKEEAIEDKDVKSSICYLCGKKASKKIKWFSTNTKNYYCLAYCKTHGYLKGKLRMKRTGSGKIYAIKIMKLVDEEGASLIKEKQEQQRTKRKERRSRRKKTLE